MVRMNRKAGNPKPCDLPGIAHIRREPFPFRQTVQIAALHKIVQQILIKLIRNFNIIFNFKPIQLDSLKQVFHQDVSRNTTHSSPPLCFIAVAEY